MLYEKAARDFRIQFKSLHKGMPHPFARHMLTQVYQKMSNGGVSERCVGVCALHKTRGTFSIAVHAWPATRFNQMLDRHMNAGGWRKGLIVTQHPGRTEFFTVGEVLPEMKKIGNHLAQDGWRALNERHGLLAAFNHFENMLGTEDISLRRGGGLRPSSDINGLHAPLLDGRAARPEILQPHRLRS